MGKWKIGNISEMATRRAKQSEIWDPRGSLGSICTIGGTLANGQISCPNMVILKISQYLENCCSQSNNKLNFDLLL